MPRDHKNRGRTEAADRAIEDGARRCVEVDKAVRIYRRRLADDNWPDFAAMLPERLRAPLEITR
jgi:hypothetical protein